MSINADSQTVTIPDRHAKIKNKLKGETKWKISKF